MRFFEKNMPEETPTQAKYISFFGQSPVPIACFPEEYAGQREIRLACTQHRQVSPYQQRKITDGWVEFLQSQQLSLETVCFCTRLPQDVFDAVCCQENITSLWIKWCAVPDLTRITKLKNLKTFYIGLGTAVKDISPLAGLEKLEVLRLGNTVKITDYSPVGALKRLKTLEIRGFDSLNPVTISMESDAFLGNLTELELLNLPEVRVEQRSFLHEENVRNIHSVCFRR